ncbi:hypothetical protein D3C77_346840 [compost metagenome]
MPINTMQRHQVRIVQAANQPPQQGMFDIFARRGDRQEMRFVGHHQMLVDVQDLLFERDRFLVGYFAKIVDAQPLLVSQRHTDRLTLGIQYPAADDPVKPLLTPDRLEMLTQAIEHGGPVARWQADRTGLMLGRVERGSGHGNARDW